MPRNMETPVEPHAGWRLGEQTVLLLCVEHRGPEERCSWSSGRNVDRRGHPADVSGRNEEQVSEAKRRGHPCYVVKSWAKLHVPSERCRTQNKELGYLVPNAS